VCRGAFSGELPRAQHLHLDVGPRQRRKDLHRQVPRRGVAHRRDADAWLLQGDDEVQRFQGDAIRSRRQQKLQRNLVSDAIQRNAIQRDALQRDDIHSEATLFCLQDTTL